MSSKFDKSLLVRGATLHGPVATITAAMEEAGATVNGMEKWMEDASPNSAAVRSKRRTLLRIVKNSSGINLKPGRMVSFKLGTNGCEVDGYTYVIGQGDYGVVDEYLPTAGVRNKDSFYVAIKGPSEMVTNTAGDATNLIPQGSLVMAATAASSQNDTNAGRVSVYSVADPSTATIAAQNHNNSANAAGRAQSGKTTANTDVRILVDLDYHR
jgi:hypothetical protein